MTTNFSIYHMVADASIVVQVILAMLLAASIVSWAIIFRKVGELKKARQQTDDFENRFWSGVDLNEFYKRLEDDASSVALARIFRAGFREFIRLVRHGQRGTDALVSTRRAMEATRSRELEQLERSMGFLATVGSTAPYVGLFGTVWGIMSAFQGLGHAAQATLSMVAPGISEALIATAMGLFAAIPAMIAYNRFISQVDSLDARFEAFGHEFTNVLEFHRVEKNGKAT